MAPQTRNFPDYQRNWFNSFYIPCYIVTGSSVSARRGKKQSPPEYLNLPINRRFSVHIHINSSYTGLVRTHLLSNSYNLPAICIWKAQHWNVWVTDSNSFVRSELPLTWWIRSNIFRVGISSSINSLINNHTHNHYTGWRECIIIIVFSYFIAQISICCRRFFSFLLEGLLLNNV